ncbi:MAG: 50S ribosomal protein L29 [Candidatus Liptonbacteria bacterium RIFCSPLOWO2_01_FULL_53_13]|uniref:Large ribosomal subunit protein uL29 n=1 Tax=Candidatus Liptonbacteria bacterium RIFCSPLOWO2_01_FULL_53_13 TaxID=1798651 RepID=A0A1G2CKJ8_9BACT|nr:MAG: 50S ribosomal protein L29 [Candidatus Liptonbacteria bacterium RIFCSPLOWO2_01_FULL_53_13]
MTREEFKQLKQKPAAEVEAALKEAREKLRVLTFDLAAGKVKNVAALREQKKDIARMLTVLRNYE